MAGHPRVGVRATPRRIVGLAMVTLVLAAWFLWLRPPWLGGSLTLVRVAGHSMEPGMYTGDLAIVRADAAYDVGEVVAFRIPGPNGPGSIVIHRIVAIDDGIMTMRGDNNPGNDPWKITQSDIAGQLWLHVPAAGRVVGVIADPVTLAALAASATVFLVLIGGPKPAEGFEQSARNQTGAERAAT